MLFDQNVQVEETQEYVEWVASHDPEWLMDLEADLIESANRELLEVEVIENCPF